MVMYILTFYATNLMENHVKKQIEDQHGNVYFNMLLLALGII